MKVFSKECAMLFGLFLGASAVTAAAGPLMDRVASGEPIRIGFANEVPWAYPDENGEPKGFVNTMAIETLKRMGYTNIEAVQTDWGGLIPGLQANRFDIITGGMYILKERCDAVAFSDPILTVSDVFIVPKGNPKGLQSYADVASTDSVLVTCAGCNTIGDAKEAGVASDKILELPEMNTILTSVTAGRADAGVGPFFTMKAFADASGGAVELTDPANMPETSKNWSGIAFRKEDSDFVTAYNEAQKGYIGSEEMLKAVAPYSYTADVLPDGMSTEWVCENR